MAMDSPRGLFVGMTTVDLVYGVEDFPTPNSKTKASVFTMHPGGPAYNAAVTFAFLGGCASVVSAIGRDPLAALVRQDAERFGVTLQDAAPTVESLPVSSVLVETANGNRTVVSRPPIAAALAVPRFAGPADIILTDGNYPEVALQVLGQKPGTAKVVLDGGSWKPGLERLLPLVDVAVCSEHFAPPGVTGSAAIAEALQAIGTTQVAITRGQNPILWFDGASRGTIQVDPVGRARHPWGRRHLSRRVLLSPSRRQGLSGGP